MKFLNIFLLFQTVASTEAATGGFLWEKVFLEISQNLLENTYAKVSFNVFVFNLYLFFWKKRHHKYKEI